MADMKLGIAGAGGRMGQMLTREIAATEGAVLVAALGAPGSAALGRDVGALAGLGETGVRIGEDGAALFARADGVLEFTTPEATVAHAALAAQSHAVLVIGTTGLDAAQARELEMAARHCPIVWADNTSVGINLLRGLTRQVARALGAEWDIEIVEMHHKHKVDAPSGTALALGRAAAAGRGVSLDDVAVRGRDGHTAPRRAGDIGFAALRGGDVVGDHGVIFAGAAERIELTHRAAGREIYARGAIRAALWAHGREPGLYDMADVLGLSG